MKATKAKGKEPNWTLLQPWFMQAFNYGVLNNTRYAVEYGSPEAAAWLNYFGTLGWTPCAIKEAIKSKRKWTAPCRTVEEWSQAHA